MEFVNYHNNRLFRDKYLPNPEIYDRIQQSVDEYINQVGSDPGVLLLGWGSYLSFCVTFSEIHGHTKHGQVLKLTVFDGIPIKIDPGYEFRVVCLANNDDPFEDAVRCFFDSKKIK